MNDQIKEMYAYYKQVGSLKKVGAKYSMSKQAVHQLFRYHKLLLQTRGVPKGKYPFFTDEQVNQMEKMYETMNSLEIAKHFKTTSATVVKYLKNSCVRRRRTGSRIGRTKLSSEHIKQLCLEYENIGALDLAKKYNISLPTVLKYLRDNGKDIRKQGEKV